MNELIKKFVTEEIILNVYNNMNVELFTRSLIVFGLLFLFLTYSCCTISGKIHNGAAIMLSMFFLGICSIPCLSVQNALYENGHVSAVAIEESTAYSYEEIYRPCEITTTNEQDYKTNDINIIKGIEVEKRDVNDGEEGLVLIEIKDIEFNKSKEDLQSKEITKIDNKYYILKAILH